MAKDWKTKYMDMRSKLLRATDVAYRLGYEEGLKDAEQQQMVQQQQAAEQAALAAAQGGMPPGAPGAPPEEGAPGQPPQMEEGAPPDEMADMPLPEDEDMPEQGGSELDQHIEELEGLVAKGEKPSIINMRKAVQKISDIRKSQKHKKKIENKMVPAQKRLVDNILKKWETESKGINSDLEDILKEQGIKLED